MNLFKILALMGLGMPFSSPRPEHTIGTNFSSFSPSEDLSDLRTCVAEPLAALNPDDGVKQPGEQLTQKLKQAYLKHNGITLPFEDGSIPFKDLYTDLELKGSQGLVKNEPNTHIPFSEIGSSLDPKTGQPVRRTWIEGVAGTGKTTLIKRILYEWALPINDERRINNAFLSQYQAVIYLPLRHILRLFEKREEPYSYADFLSKSKQWQHWVLMGRGAAFGEDALADLAYLLNERPNRVLMLVDGLDEVDPNHPLLRDVFLNPQHNFIVTTRPQVIPAWLESYLDREIVVQGFNEKATIQYIEKYYQRLKARGQDKSEQEQEFKEWITTESHLADFTRVPLNCHLLCVISSHGILPINPTYTALYDLILVQLIKRALTKSEEMRKIYGIEAATELDVLTAIHEKYSEQDLLAKSEPWILNLEEIAFRCIKESDSITVSGEQIAAVIRSQNPELDRKQLIERMQQLIFFGILSPRGLDPDKFKETYEYNHKTFLEHKAGRFAARQYLSELRLADGESDKEVYQLFFDPKHGYGFYEYRFSFLLRFTTGAINRIAKTHLLGKELVTHWVSRLIKAYQKDFWGSGTLLQLFGCLLEIDHNWDMYQPIGYYTKITRYLWSWLPFAGYAENGYSQLDQPYESQGSITDINSLKLTVMQMLWGYAKAKIGVGDDWVSLDEGFAKYWRMAYLQLDSATKAEPAFVELLKRIQADGSQTVDENLKKSALKLLEIMGSDPVKFESTTKLVAVSMPKEEPWVQQCSQITRHSLAQDIRVYMALHKVIRYFDKIKFRKEDRFKSYFSHQSIRNVLHMMIDKSPDLNNLDGVAKAVTTLYVLLNTTLSEDQQSQIVKIFFKEQLEMGLYWFEGLSASFEELMPLVNDFSDKHKQSILELVVNEGMLAAKKYSSFTDFKGLMDLVPIIIDLECTKQAEILDTLLRFYHESNDGGVRAKVTSIFARLHASNLESKLAAPNRHYVKTIKVIMDEQLYKLNATDAERKAVIADWVQLTVTADMTLSQQEKIVTAVVDHMLAGDSEEVVVAAVKTLAVCVEVMGSFQSQMQQLVVNSLLERLNRPDGLEDLVYHQESFDLVLDSVLIIVSQAELSLMSSMIDSLFSRVINATQSVEVRRISIGLLGSLSSLLGNFGTRLQYVLINALSDQLSSSDVLIRSVSVEAFAKVVSNANITSDEIKAVFDTLIYKLYDNYINIRKSLVRAFVILKPISDQFSDELKRHYYDVLFQIGLNEFWAILYVEEISKNFYRASYTHPSRDLNFLKQYISWINYAQVADRKGIQATLINYYPMIAKFPAKYHMDIIRTLLWRVQSDSTKVILELTLEIIELFTPIIQSFSAIEQRNLLSHVSVPLNLYNQLGTRNDAVDALQVIPNPFDSAQQGGAHFSLVQPLLLAALQSNQVSLTLSADDLFNFSRKLNPDHKELWGLSLDVFKVRIQWLIIVSHYPSHDLQIQARFWLEFFESRLSGFLHLGSLLGLPFDVSLALNALKLHMLDWQLPWVIRGSTSVHYQFVGRDEVGRSNARHYGNQFSDWRPLSVQQLNVLLDDCAQQVPDEDATSYFSWMIDLRFIIFLVALLAVCCFFSEDDQAAEASESSNKNRFSLLSDLITDFDGDPCLNNLLGAGSFADVYAVRWKEKQVAFKKFKCQTESENLRQLSSEASMLRKFPHRNIVELLGVCLYQPNLGLLMEYMEGGSLQQKLGQTDHELPWTERVHIATEVSYGLQHLHSNGIIHRDLKTSNILVGSNGEIKIADLGLAKSSQETTEIKSEAGPAAGTVAWSAPEVLKSKRYSFASDIYSLALVLWAIATQREPWADKLQQQITFAVLMQRSRPPITDNDRVPPAYSKLIRSCWVVKPKRRLEINSVVDALQAITIP